MLENFFFVCFRVSQYNTHDGREGGGGGDHHRRSLSGRPGVVAANMEKFGAPGGKQTDQ